MSPATRSEFEKCMLSMSEIVMLIRLHNQMRA